MDQELSRLSPSARAMCANDALLLEADARLTGPPGHQVQDASGQEVQVFSCVNVDMDLVSKTIVGHYIYCPTWMSVSLNCWMVWW